LYLNKTKEFDLTTVTLAIIARGMGRQMDMLKAWLWIGNESILAWLHGELGWPGPTMLASSRATANLPNADLIDQELVDSVDDLGPLYPIEIQWID
jgi:hypothetical protein